MTFSGHRFPRGDEDVFQLGEERLHVTVNTQNATELST